MLSYQRVKSKRWANAIVQTFPNDTLICSSSSSLGMTPLNPVAKARVLRRPCFTRERTGKDDGQSRKSLQTSPAKARVEQSTMVWAIDRTCTPIIPPSSIQRNVHPLSWVDNPNEVFSYLSLPRSAIFGRHHLGDVSLKALL